MKQRRSTLRWLAFEQEVEQFKKQLQKAQRSVKKNGRDSAAAAKELEKTAELFKFLKLPPRQFDPMVERVRSTAKRLE